MTKELAHGEGLMFRYYMSLAIRNFRIHITLSALLILAIGFGIAASSTTYAIFHAMSGDPIPQKSKTLYVPQIDVWGPSSIKRDGEPSESLTYIDSIELMRGQLGGLQTAVYPFAAAVYSEDISRRPRSIQAHAVSADFFPMLDVPFLKGTGWSRGDDQSRAQVAVISRTLSEATFGSDDTVGRSIRLNNNDYRVVGVIDHWNPQPRFYDVVNADAFGHADDAFIPFSTGISQQVETSGPIACPSGKPLSGGFSPLLASSCTWIGFLVQLSSAEKVTQYRNYLDAYAQQQRQSGRFNWSPNNRLRALPQWLDYMQVVPSNTRISLLISFGLLVVCMVNTISLMLAMYLRRSREIGVRRALGATRVDVMAQFAIQSAVIGISGGVLGIALTVFGITWLTHWLPDSIADLVHVNMGLFIRSLLLSIAATMLASLYPIWRAANVRPAIQIKS
jgi:putative ABC transport system permease protein